MLYLDQDRFSRELERQNLSLSALAKQAGISRQSLYKMFARDPVFNTPFQKILDILKVDFEKLTHRYTSADIIYSEAPESIQNVMKKLFSFCQTNRANLYLFGSRARGKKGKQSDWDFGIAFYNQQRSNTFASIKAEMKDAAFPYQVDVVNLNDAPGWFLTSIEKEKIWLYGKNK